MARITVEHIVREWLIQYGHDGLCGYECGCGLDDLCPCGGIVSDCVPAKKFTECDDPECVWYGEEHYHAADIERKETADDKQG